MAKDAMVESWMNFMLLVVIFIVECDVVVADIMLTDVCCCLRVALLLG